MVGMGVNVGNGVRVTGGRRVGLGVLVGMVGVMEGSSGVLNGRASQIPSFSTPAERGVNVPGSGVGGIGDGYVHASVLVKISVHDAGVQAAY